MFCSEEVLKPAGCSICERTFKNVQALNGHMRCHGGYFKKVMVHMNLNTDVKCKGISVLFLKICRCKFILSILIHPQV